MARAGSRHPGPPTPDAGFVEGAYACYSYAFTPYFPGWLIRSSMIIGAGPWPGLGGLQPQHAALAD